MAHAIWSGSISFGLVTIPVKLQTAVRENDLRFNFLHKKDQGRINNVRRCSVCGEEVSYADLERGYEIEKGEYVIVTDDDFKRVNVEATQTVDIVSFVDLGEIDPMFFDKPYYLQPEKVGRHAYALLRDALRAANKVGIAKVVIRAREHLAAVKPRGDALILELMRFADEIVDATALELPGPEKLPEPEMKMANLLIESMTAAFDAGTFHDTYREQLMTMIEERAAGKEPAAVAAAAPKRSKVVDLMEVLERSLEESRKRRPEPGERTKPAKRRAS